MPVTFRTPAHGSLIYTDAVAGTLLKLMGRTGNVPGAIDAAAVADALDTLKRGLARHADAAEDPATEARDAPEAVVLGTRAYPLVELLEAASEAKEYVAWE
ncbi:MAG: DUF1840 family protein [Pseudomonadota bacterium]